MAIGTSSAGGHQRDGLAEFLVLWGELEVGLLYLWTLGKLSPVTVGEVDVAAVGTRSWPIRGHHTCQAPSVEHLDPHPPT